MKNQTLLFIFFILSLNCFSQISFEKGYFIEDDGQKTNCLIKNMDWLTNPTEFEYKLSEHDEPKIATIESVKEFSINEVSKYIRSTVRIDMSSDDTDNLSNERNPILKLKTMFLKVLIEGEASLYQYVDGNLKRFFYDVNNSNIEQLIYKRYKITNFRLGRNNRYKQQLSEALKCPSIKLNNIENLAYKKSSLLSLFITYNTCKNEGYYNYAEGPKRDAFILTLRPGLNNSRLSIDFPNSDSRDADFGNELNFRVGIEFEYVLPFNKNKWSFIVEPTYQYFQSETVVRTQNIAADYKSIELPIGVRHYIFLNDNSKIFFNASIVYDFDFDSLIDFEFTPDVAINSKGNFGLGLGYKYNNRYSLEFRYLTNRQSFNLQFRESDYNTISLIFGYSIF